MEPKYQYELTTEQKRFIATHTKMSVYGIAQILKVGSFKVKQYRELLNKQAA